MVLFYHIVRPPGRYAQKWEVIVAISLLSSVVRAWFDDNVMELRERQLSKEGQAQLRQRVTVEHSLADVGQWQGRCAHYG